MNTDIKKQFEQLAEALKSSMPVVKMNANGYEIRTKVLDLANSAVWQDYHAKWGQFEATATKSSTGEIVTTVKMPEVPGADTVLETAQKFYDFVNGNANKKN